MTFGRAGWSVALCSIGALAMATTANAVPLGYTIDTVASSASVTVELEGVPIGSGAFNITWSSIVFDAAAPSLDGLEISGTSVAPILLSQPVNVGLGDISSVFVDSATMVDGGLFTTSTLVPGLVYQSDGPIDVTSSLTTDLGPQAFGFSDTLSAFPIVITDNGTDVTLELSGFTLASFDVYDSLGNIIPDGLTVKMDLGIAANPIPEPSAALLFMVALGVVSPFVRTTARRTTRHTRHEGIC